MSAKQVVFLGTDGGATTSKVGGVWSSGTPISTTLLQRSTDSQQGPDAVVRGWVAAIVDYLVQNKLDWDQVRGVGLATPGPFRRYGVLDRSANLPDSFAGFDVHTAYSVALAEQARRPVAADCRKRRRYGRRGRGAARTRRRLRNCGYACPGLGPGLRVHRPSWSAARGRYPGRDGRRAHAGRAARARRQAVSMRLRPDLGLHRGVHHTLRPAVPAGRKARPAPRPRAGALRARVCASERWHCAAWPSRAIQLAVEIFDFQARALGHPCRQPGDGARPAVRRHRRRPDGPAGDDARPSASAISASFANSALPYLWPAQREQLADRPGDAGRSVAGDRRGAGGTVPQPQAEDGVLP